MPQDSQLSKVAASLLYALHIDLQVAVWYPQLAEG